MLLLIHLRIPFENQGSSDLETAVNMKEKCDIQHIQLIIAIRVHMSLIHQKNQKGHFKNLVVIYTEIQAKPFNIEF
jgi:hypothetical protein